MAMAPGPLPESLVRLATSRRKRIVVGVLVGEAFLDDDGLGVAGVVAQEEGERGAGLDWR